MNKKISIIVPVYNVEKYLRGCLTSIINQSYDNLEIILIDDGSPDNCPNICDEYAKIDQRIIVIHKKNEGLSVARNCGLEIATGEYIMFVDSDDSIDKKMCEILISQANIHKADIVMSDCEKVKDGAKSSHKKYNNKSIKKDIYDNNDEIVDLLFNRKVPLIMLAWGKLYKKEIFSNIRFPVKKIHEDEFIIHEVLSRCYKFVFVHAKLYKYLIRKTSITGEKFNKSRLAAIEAKMNRVKFISLNYPQFVEKANIQLANTLILNYFKCKWNKIDNREIFNQIQELKNKGVKCKILYLFYKFPIILEIALKIKFGK